MTTKAQTIVDVLVADAPGAREVQAEIVPYLQATPTNVMIWQTFQADPRGGAKFLVLAIEELIATHADLARQLDTLLAARRQGQAAPHTVTTTTVETDGGAYIGGGVHMGNGGNFTGRDQVITYTSQPTLQIFQDLYRRVEASPTLAPAEKADVKADLHDVETELAKGAQADETFIQRRLRSIERMAPDILDVVLATFANPLAGLGMVAKKVAEKMKGS